MTFLTYKYTFIYIIIGMYKYTYFERIFDIYLPAKKMRLLGSKHKKWQFFDPKLWSGTKFLTFFLGRKSMKTSECSARCLCVTLEKYTHVYTYMKFTKKWTWFILFIVIGTKSWNHNFENVIIVIFFSKSNIL